MLNVIKIDTRLVSSIRNLSLFVNKEGHQDSSVDIYQSFIDSLLDSLVSSGYDIDEDQTNLSSFGIGYVFTRNMDDPDIECKIMIKVSGKYDPKTYKAKAHSANAWCLDTITVDGEIANSYDDANELLAKALSDLE